MITVLPVRDADKGYAIQKREGLNAPFDCLFTAEEAGEERGFFTLVQEKNALLISKISLSGALRGQALGAEGCFVLELMVRSAASYALNRNLPLLRCAGEEYGSFLKGMGFQKAEDGYEILIEQLFHRCNHC